jgi:hypothetical protein
MIDFTGHQILQEANVRSFSSEGFEGVGEVVPVKGVFVIRKSGIFVYSIEG